LNRFGNRPRLAVSIRSSPGELFVDRPRLIADQLDEYAPAEVRPANTFFPPNSLSQDLTVGVSNWHNQPTANPQLR